MRVLLWWLFALVLGALVATAAAGAYWFIEWRAGTLDPHDRGLWEGAVAVAVVTGGMDLARRVLGATFRTRDGR